MSVQRDGKQLCTTYKVRGYHVDINGHVNNAVYLNYLEDARDDFLKHLGFSIAEFQARGDSVVLAEVHIRFIQPALYGDILEARGWLSELRRVRSTWRMELWRAGTGVLLTQAWVKVAFLDRTGRVIPIPEAARARLETVYIPEPSVSHIRGGI